MCTKKSASDHRALALELALLNDWHESAAHFERPAEQALALATEPQAKRKARSVLCHTYQKSARDVQEAGAYPGFYVGGF